MIRIYGSPRTSSGRCFLLLEELALPYEVAPLDMMGGREHKSEAYLRLNPNGKVPALVDGDFVLWESMAINWYLAEKYRPELLGTNPRENGLIQQWTFWSVTELQPPLVDMIIQLMFTPDDKRDMNVAAKARAKIPPLLKVLDETLKGKSHIVGDRFTLADINVASVVNITAAFDVPLAEYPNLLKWFASMKERPAFKKFLEKRQ